VNTQKVISCCLALLLLGVAPTEAQDRSGRDIKTYEDGGSYELTWGASGPDELEKIKERVRTFIWGHWQRKQAAYITVRDCTAYFDGCDGPTFFALYVEPDEKGGWRIAEEAVHYVAGSNGGKEFRGSTPPVIFTNVERARPEEAGTCPPFFSSLVETKSHTFLLRFVYDKSKKDLGRSCIIF
jgi:hypothetical protein